MALGDGETNGRRPGALDASEVWAGSVEEARRLRGPPTPEGGYQTLHGVPIWEWTNAETGEKQAATPNWIPPNGNWLPPMPGFGGRAVETGETHAGDAVVDASPPNVGPFVKKMQSEQEMETRIADGLRLRAMPYLAGLMKVMNDAQAHGMSVNWNVGRAPSGRFVIGPIDVIKHL